LLGTCFSTAQGARKFSQFFFEGRGQGTSSRHQKRPVIHALFRSSPTYKYPPPGPQTPHHRRQSFGQQQLARLSAHLSLFSPACLASGDHHHRSVIIASMTKHGVVIGPEDVAAARHFSFPPPRTAAGGESCRKLAAQVDLGPAVVGSWLDSMKASSPRHRLMAPVPGAADAEHDDWMVRARGPAHGRRRNETNARGTKKSTRFWCRSGTRRHWTASTRWRRRPRGSRSRCSWTTTARCPRSWRTPTAPS
jgi:hypothetical protein